MSYRGRILSRYKGVQMDHLLGEEITQESYELHARTLKRKLGHLLPTDREARILDLGCGLGFLLYMLKKQGYSQAMGVEINQEQARIAQSLDLKVTEEDVMAFMEKDREKFHLIFINHLLEHLTKDEAVGLLEKAFFALERGGRIVVTVPNAASPFGLSLAFGDFTHEIFFSPTSLREVLSLTGFTSIEVQGEKVTGPGWKGIAKSVLWTGFSFLLKSPLMLVSRDPSFYVLEPVILATGVKGE